jgi:hypothetical protein
MQLDFLGRYSGSRIIPLHEYSISLLQTLSRIDLIGAAMLLVGIGET